MENALIDGFKGERAIVTPYNIRAFQAGNDITRRMYLTHIGYYPEARHHRRERPSGARQNIFIYCHRGEGWVECGGERHTLRENSFFIIPADAAHSYGASPREPWSIYWFHFGGDMVGLFSSIMGRPVSLPASDTSRFSDRMQLFDAMYRNLEMGYSPENLEYITFCLMHFLASLKYLSQYREIKKVKEDDVVQRTILFMKENVEGGLSLADIAGATGYSTSRLTALFKRQTSFPPMEYYAQLRIQRACSYLQFTGLKIKEIAFRLNYYDPFHFSKAFRTEMGITPKEYRRRYRDM